MTAMVAVFAASGSKNSNPIAVAVIFGVLAAAVIGFTIHNIRKR